jgi:hypothetical protein
MAESDSNALNEKAAAREEKRVGWFPKLLAALSFIPFLGPPIGLLVVGYGIARRASGGALLAVIAALGIAVTPVTFGVLLASSIEIDRFLRQSRQQFTATQLDHLIQSIEYYKLVNERYPASLQELEAELGGAAGLFPATIVSVDYRVSKDGTLYSVRFVGPDGVPRTTDDVLPALSSRELKRVGFRDSVQ